MKNPTDRIQDVDEHLCCDHGKCHETCHRKHCRRLHLLALVVLELHVLAVAVFQHDVLAVVPILIAIGRTLMIAWHLLTPLEIRLLWQWRLHARLQTHLGLDALGIVEIILVLFNVRYLNCLVYLRTIIVVVRIPE